ncbi:MAG: class I SAM-dependent methyltransferase [Planctomycetes bacterium]|nr:class I SAM-dependent methyltransferase [Planctomycetota bacterium]
MKILSRAICTIKGIGLKRTVKLIQSRLEDYVFDIRYGTDTMRQVELDDLEIESENKHRAEAYGATKVRHFEKLMQALDLPIESGFVDFGSGKGRVLLMASQNGFKKVVGVEFSRELCEIARRNISIYKEKVGIEANIEVYEGDAANYEIKNDENIFFFFHPFDELLMNKVLGNIVRSLEKQPRKIWLIDHDHWAYRDNSYRDIIKGHDVFVKLDEYVFDGYESSVYVNEGEG